MNGIEGEKHELARAVDRLGKSTRPGRLLEYLGAKYFEGHSAQLNEFTIAFEVFGRSEKNFDPTEDAVVRVEAHRLRKKLRDLYDKDERASGLKISLPAGTYVPTFTPISEPRAPADAPTPDAALAMPVASVNTRRSRWQWIIGGAALALSVAGLWLVVNPPPAAPTARPSPATVPAPAAGAAGAQAVTELHLMAGHSGSEIIDNSGVRWTPDQYYRSGGVWSRDSGYVRGTSRQFLFATYRTGEFGYEIPVAPGSYELRLHFVTPNQAGDEKLAGFNVFLSGQTLLSAYDVAMSANGAGVADEQVFRDVMPDRDGRIRLWFSNQMGSPMLNGLEIAPGAPGRLRPIRITTQPTAFVDHQGQRWRADDYYQNGFVSTSRRRVSGTDDPELFAGERFGHFSYAIPVDRRGRYTVVLHFAEFYYGAQLTGGGGVGSRVFHVFCNGATLLRDFDIYKEAGSLRVISKTFRDIVPSSQGKINLTFEPVVNNATVSGIEVLEQGS